MRQRHRYMSKDTENEQHQQSEENLFAKIWYRPDAAQSFPHGSLLSQNTQVQQEGTASCYAFLLYGPGTFLPSSSLRLFVFGLPYFCIEMISTVPPAASIFDLAPAVNLWARTVRARS